MILPLSHPLSVLLRVDHAGECAAVAICEGQRTILEQCGKHKAAREVEAIEKHEREHHAFFQQQLSQHHASSTVFLPLWKGFGWSLGALSVLLGEKAAMLCVEAVEEVIVAHYDRQLVALETLAESPEKGTIKQEVLQHLIATIKRFRDEEEHHRTIAKEHSNEESSTAAFSLQQTFYTLWKEGIALGCSCAIVLSERT